MEKIKLKFSATPSLFPANSVVVVLTLDESGKSYKVEREDVIFETPDELPQIPKRVLDAFTENAINTILSKDEIPNETGMMVLDGCSYDIKITKGKVKKEYYADNISIETYPLLKYLASWCGEIL